jgi:pimeloyl-ACP methyl ester carboxylesterase
LVTQCDCLAGLVVPPASPMAPRTDAVDNDLVRVVVVPGAGHCVRLDQPDLYHRALDAFLVEVT